MATLLLTRSDVEKLLDPSAIVEPLRAAFAAYSADPSWRAQRLRASLPGPGTATVLFPGTTPGIPAYSVKVHAKFAAQVPAIRGLLCLHDLESGALLAAMDSTYLTAVRTGVCGALAADALARRDAAAIAVVGAGVQGEQQLRSLARLRRLERVRVFDTDGERATAFATRLGAALGLPIEPSSSLVAAVRDADIILVATWSRAPFIHSGMVRADAHITTLGADEPGKCEVGADLLRQALFFCDDRALAVEMGAIAGAGLDETSIAAELGDVFRGAHPGRSSQAQITVYGGVGLAFQDLVAAWRIYEAARERRVGHEVDFLG